MDCIFCKIARNEIPSLKVHEDNDIVAFLDINPATSGHTLVMPKKHFSNIYDADEAELGRMMSVAKKIAQKLKDNLGASGVNILQNNGRPAGQIVDHLHLHVIPRYKNDGITIHFPRIPLDEKEMKEIQQKLSKDKELKDDLWNVKDEW